MGWPFRDRPTPSPDTALHPARRALIRYWEVRLLLELAPVCNVPIGNCQEWSDERRAWAIQRILEIAEETGGLE